MVRYLPIIVVLGLLIYCFIDVLATPRHRFRTLGKVPWLLVCLIPVVGAILWLVIGRPRRAHRASWQDQVIHLRRPERSVAPDDDPAFLRILDERAWRAQREAKRHGSEPHASGPSQPEDGSPTDDAAGDGPKAPRADGEGDSTDDTGEIPPQPRRGD